MDDISWENGVAETWNMLEGCFIMYVKSENLLAVSQ